MATTPFVNWRVMLKEYADIKKCKLEYTEIEKSGPDHDPTFHFEVKLLFTNVHIETKGSGKRKQSAKEHAAQAMMELLTRYKQDSPILDIPARESCTPGTFENGSFNSTMDMNPIKDALHVSNHLLCSVIFNV